MRRNDLHEFSEEELEELQIKIKTRWKSGDSVTRKFVITVHRLHDENKITKTLQAFKELLIGVIAEYLKRITKP